MGVHHIALATHDPEKTHDFYTRVMGFRLVKTIVNNTEGGGWAKHFFLETDQDDTYIAFWDLHDPTIPDTFSSAISDGLGLPKWVNHIAFAAHDLDDLALRRDHWVDEGQMVFEIDHEIFQSIYTVDPNGILVEFCVTTTTFTDADRDEALRLLRDPSPEVHQAPGVKVYGLPRGVTEEEVPAGVAAE